MYSIHDGERLSLDATTRDVSEGQQVYACGPERLLEELETIAVDWPENMLHMKRFSSQSAALTPDDEHEFDVRLKESGIVLRVKLIKPFLTSCYPSGSTLLTTARRVSAAPVRWLF
jgi:ferredoxin-NADP reductase|tara:strand:+ start:5008 stop:5355 length:348 start_codon:yes stop_codon:yes gene_type:complete